MEYILIESLKHDSFRTQWEEWVLNVAEAVQQTDNRYPYSTDLDHPETFVREHTGHDMADRKTEKTTVGPFV